MSIRSGLLAAGVALALPLLAPATAQAIPAFARKYNASCSMCHATVPRLNAFGEQFAANGFELAIGEPAVDTVDTGDPLLRLLRRIDFAVRIDLFSTVTTPIRRDEADLDLQTPYNIKLLTGGVISDRISYYMYFFMSERGEVAGLEDAYIQFTDIGGTGLSAIVGQFQVSDPLFKRELRLHYEDFQPYRVRVGDARADMTYDRGLFLTYSPWSGGDLSLMVVNGHGLDAAAENRHYDRDNDKSFALRYSQDVGPLRVGGFGYLGHERAEGEKDRITVWGPDATIALGRLELNAQYLRREDTNALFLPDAETTVVNSAFAELLWGPFGSDDRWTITGLYNWIDADAQLVSLRLGEQDTPEGFLQRYHSAAAGMHYLLRRNVRISGEAGYDIERERARFTIGTVVAF